MELLSSNDFLARDSIFNTFNHLDGRHIQLANKLLKTLSIDKYDISNDKHVIVVVPQDNEHVEIKYSTDANEDHTSNKCFN